MAHPKANGFYNAKGPAGGIPSAYTLIAAQFHDRIISNGDINRIKIFEYQRSNWTFHGKGLWYSTSKNRDPIFTLIGSPNFGYRSVHRDIEAQLAILTTHSKLRKDLQEEMENIFSSSNLVTKSTFQLPDRIVPLG
ncbi:pgsA [Lepeophtheirus salmonis]|uniref:CDP-diacylglycerol--glycerol-3-phosphate 3-phosphatidyltransferase n=1 Tax=Lepeophtheirus salmonis TaxID=72036 RepID=A0A7R8CBS3_LEPSM|nr:pgsA [Lepeophtheirus salmonis]CAF2763475.1 pgsA [Lepeophtheirus salmonis]